MSEYTNFKFYKTALWFGRNPEGEYVGLTKWHPYGNYYEIRTIDGSTFNASVNELDRFVI